MAGEWQMVRLGDYVDSNLGKMLDANKNKGVPRPYLGNSNVRWGSFELNDLALMKFEEGEEERYGIRDGDLIVCEGGEPGRCAVWREQVPDMKIQKALHRIRPKDGLNNYYLFYWFMLAGRAGWLEPFFTGTTIKHLTGKALSELKVPLPPIEEQRAIAHILGTLDDKIENLRRQNETLEAMARALFKAWFVDFEPVRAKIEGRWRRGEMLPGLPAHLYDLFPDRLVESELGEIPEGWERVTLGDIAEHPRRNIQPDAIDPDTPYIALEHMPKHSIALSDWGFASGIESNKFAFRKSEILFGKLRPYFHKVGVAPINGVCSTDIVVIAPKERYEFAFVLGLVSSDQFVEFTSAGSTGTKMPRTSWTDMARYETVRPPKSIAALFTETIQPTIERIITSIHESRTLAHLRDTLLPKLISGELRVKDAEAFLERAGA
ncbi:restriction endonuclease subunit S [Aerosticca soli]|uniref:Type I restriction-modification system, specificity subunit S n=1 Tax=Aerosticca soli TaxID=2010829 RepID=A0A2Z6E6D3_9GAMM|nr:restriction endonuclease subunit S [Aerosticca soli]BBD80118.1 type I restriction-modification system, specificity subunit S [Aerosticca soli]